MEDPVRFLEALQVDGAVGLEIGAIAIAGYAASAGHRSSRAAELAEHPSSLAGRTEMVDHTIAAAQMRLDALAGDVQAATRGASPGLEELRRFLFTSGQFSGNRDDYYDPANSYLPEVMARGLGNPITLCVLAIAIGRRLNIELAGVGMPAHFLLRAAHEEIWIDVFDGGKTMDLMTSEQLFVSVTGGRIPFDPAFLEPTPTGQILARMLANLHGIFLQRRDPDSLGWVGHLAAVIPQSGARDAGEAAKGLGALGRFDLAAQVLDAAARHVSGASSDGLKERAAAMWARLN